MPREEDWARLAREIATQRASREPMSDRELARRAGIAASTLDKLLHARADRYRPETLARVEAALGWAPGSIQEVLAGRRPRPEVDPTLRELSQLWPSLSTQGRRAVLGFARHVLETDDRR